VIPNSDGRLHRQGLQGAEKVAPWVSRRPAALPYRRFAVPISLWLRKWPGRWMLTSGLHSANLEHELEHRDQESRCAGDHMPEHGVPIAPADLRCAMRPDQRTRPRMKANGSSSQPNRMRRAEHGAWRARPLLALLLGRNSTSGCRLGRADPARQADLGHRGRASARRSGCHSAEHPTDTTQTGIG